jgi:NADH-quinone oxidoreductase subunit M
MPSNGLLILALFGLPLLGSLAVPFLPASENGKIARIWGMLCMLGVLAMAGGVFAGFGTACLDPKLLDLNLPWVGSLGINFHLGVDGLNIYLLLLTGLLFPVVLGCCWKRPETQNSLFVAMALLLEATLVGTFLAQNLMLFFVFWEVVLIPMFIIILAFGGENRRSAAFTFFMYTMAGSILFLAAVILMGMESLNQTGAWNFEFASLTALKLGWNLQLFVFIAVMLACAIKCPLFPFHSWLPLAYYEAPPAGTALMAGALSKMGAFGIIKLALPLCPDVARAFGPEVMILAVVSILYGAIIALKQSDFKKLVAFSSLSHMGYIVLGIFSFHQAAMNGALFQILSHGVAVAGLFLLLGLLELRLGREYLNLTALSTHAPRLAVMLMLFILASVALPLTSGFTSEFLILFGAFQQGIINLNANLGATVLVTVLLASTGMVLGATYMLRFGRAILYGQTRDGVAVKDLSLSEGLGFIPLLVMVLWIGVNPMPIMTKVTTAVSALAAQPANAQTQPAAQTAPAAKPATPTPTVKGGANGH